MKSVSLTLPPFGSLIAGQAGILAAIMRGLIVDGVEQPPYALLVSEAATGEIEACEWGNYGTEIPGAASRNDGQANTAAMAAANCPAAVLLHGKEIAGHADWFLPSLAQLNAAGANVPEQFRKEGYYWTSTQHSRDGAFVQVFELGLSGWDGKDGSCRVRAFRAIPLESLTT